MLPEWCQAIIWTNAGILLTGPLRTNFSKILIEINTFSFKKMNLKMASEKWRPFCLCLNVLRLPTEVTQRAPSELKLALLTLGLISLMDLLVAIQISVCYLSNYPHMTKKTFFKFHDTSTVTGDNREVLLHVKRKRVRVASDSGAQIRCASRSRTLLGFATRHDVSADKQAHRYQQMTRQQPIKHIRKQKWTYTT